MNLNWLRRILKIRSPTAMILEPFSQGLIIASNRLRKQMNIGDRVKVVNPASQFDGEEGEVTFISETLKGVFRVKLDDQSREMGFGIVELVPVVVPPSAMAVDDGPNSDGPQNPI